MDNISIFLEGLLLTLVLALLPAVIGVAPGILLLNGKNRKHGIWYWISTSFIEFFRGIPLLVQLPFIFYVLPLIWPNFTISAIPTAIVIFTLNAAAVFPGIVRNILPIESHNGDESLDRIKIYVLASVELLRKTIIYSAFAGVLAISDMYKTAADMIDNPLIYISAAVLIFLIFSIGLKLIQKMLRNVFFKPLPPPLNTAPAINRKSPIRKQGENKL